LSIFKKAKLLIYVPVAGNGDCSSSALKTAPTLQDFFKKKDKLI
jgi:hypothetical protein